MTIDEVIKKEEQKLKSILFATRKHAFALLTAEEKSAVADSVHEILQQKYIPLVNAIGQMAKLTGVDTSVCGGDIVSLADIIIKALLEKQCVKFTERDMSTLLGSLENPPRPKKALRDDFHAYRANKNPHFQIKKDKQ